MSIITSDLIIFFIEYTLLGIIIGVMVSVKVLKTRTYFSDIWNVVFSLGLIFFIIMALFMPDRLYMLGTLGTFVVSFLTFRSIYEMKAARIAEFRPRVVLDFDIPYETSIIELIVKNEGRSAAKNIIIKTTPNLIDSKKRNLSNFKMFKDGIKFLTGNKEIRQIFDSGPLYLTEDKTHPLQFNVELTYEDVDGNKYNDEMTLDLEIYKWLQFLPKKR